MSEKLFQIDETYFLYAVPSFLEGMARVMDLGSTLEIYNESPSGVVADYNALTNDWRAVGKDLANSIIVQASP